MAASVLTRSSDTADAVPTTQPRQHYNQRHGDDGVAARGACQRNRAIQCTVPGTLRIGRRSGTPGRGIAGGDNSGLRALAHAREPLVQVLDVPAGLAISNTPEACVLGQGNSRTLLWKPTAALADYSFGQRGPWVAGMQRALLRSGDYTNAWTAWQASGPQMRSLHSSAATCLTQRLPDPLTRFLIEQQDRQPAPTANPEPR